MKTAICARKWQVEAARDARLHGKDREAALRHQTTCPECAAEARELAAMGQSLAHLPELERDALTTRRTRQRLMAALNEAVLEPAPPSSRRGLAIGLGLSLAALAAVWLFVERGFSHPQAPKAAGSVVEVHTEPGVRWSEQTDRALDRVNLFDGAASFTVHPHPGRRVLILVPDGEIEDTGTVFELSVAEQRTKHIGVSEGRVSVRLRGQPEFSLTAGNDWNSPAGVATAAASNASAPTEAEPSTPAAISNATASARSPFVRGRPHPSSSTEAHSAIAAPKPSSEAPPKSAAPTESANAEDDAYLHIVELLRQGKSGDARSEAKSYLLRFPNGFRRVEVLNIATRITPAAADPE